MKKFYLLILVLLFSSACINKEKARSFHISDFHIAKEDLIFYNTKANLHEILSKEEQEVFISWFKPANFIEGYEKSALFIPEISFTVFTTEGAFAILFSPSGNQLKIISKNGENIFNYDPIASQLNVSLQKWLK